MTKYLVLEEYGSVLNDLFKDIELEHNIYYINQPKNIIFDIARKLYRIVYDKGKNNIPLPRKDYFYTDLLGHIDDGTTLVFTTEFLSAIDAITLHNILERNRNGKNVLLLLDSLKAHSAHIEQVESYIFDIKWDKVFCFDVEDCKEYGFDYLGFAYYSAKPLESKAVTYDLYYIGRNKVNDGRMEQINRLDKLLTEENVNGYISILEGGFWNRRNPFFHSMHNNKDSNITKINKPASYDQVLNDVMQSNCILELLQNGQQQQSARYFEAICYNKKLLTNNPNISSLPYYNPEYMKYFATVEDIDWDWVKRKESVEYHYKGDFSPLRMIEQIDKSFAE